MNKGWTQVTVVGCGLIGGSFAQALRGAGECDRIFGWDADVNVLREARARGIIDDIDPGFDRGGQSTSDLIYLAMPVLAIINLFVENASVGKPGCLITDAGSTKVEICETARKYLSPDVSFIGGHPMAGSHLGGLSKSRSDLFRDATYLLVKEADDCRNDLDERLRATLRAIGARVKVTTAKNHDCAMAFISHLPQLLSNALAATVNDQIDHQQLISFAGPAYRDMTRLSSSPWNIWRDILATNSENVDAALADFIDQLQQVRKDLKGTKLLDTV